MPTLEVHQVDASNDARLAAWHAATDRAMAHGREDTSTVLRLEELGPLLTGADRTSDRRAYAARSGADVVATAWLELSLLDNTRRAELVVAVVPEARREGHGSRLLAHMEQVLREAGRTLIASEVTWPVEGDRDGAGSPGVEFARAHSFALGLRELQRHLRLPVADDLLDRLAAEAAPHHASYELVGFTGSVPEQHLLGWCRLDSTLMTEAPTGDLHLEPAVVDIAAQREAEARFEAQGRTKHTTLALDATGEVVAYTDLAVTVHEPDRAYQWGTLVRADHRGHRLGTAVKVANLRRLQAAHPELVRLVTWNAEDNPHMVGVNERLGFVPVEWAGGFQRHLV